MNGAVQYGRETLLPDGSPAGVAGYHGLITTACSLALGFRRKPGKALMLARQWTRFSFRRSPPSTVETSKHGDHQARIHIHGPL